MLIHDCEQGTDSWHALRAGVPTASEFSSIITSDGKPSKSLRPYAAQLAAELFAGVPLDRFAGNRHTERGHELEDQARSAYAFLHDVEPVQVGFVTNHGAGASPDSLIGDEGACEIKCLQAKHHVLALAYIDKNGRAPTDYVAQCHGQILICEREWVDLWFYHPDLPCRAVRIEKDEAFQAALLKQIQAVIAERDRFMAILQEAA